MFAVLILSLVILANGCLSSSLDEARPEGKNIANEGQCRSRCDELFSKSANSLPKSDVWFSCYRGCRLSGLLNKTDDRTKKRISNTCDKGKWSCKTSKHLINPFCIVWKIVCTEIYNKTTLEKSCQIGCSFEEPVVTKKSSSLPKAVPKFYKNKLASSKKKIPIPLLKNDVNTFPMPFPIAPWTLRFFEKKSEVREDDDSKEDSSQQPLVPQMADVTSFSRDPIALLSRLFKSPFILPNSESVKITKSTVTVYGGDGQNDVQVFKSDSSNPGVIERTVISPSMDWVSGDLPIETEKKPASPSTEKTQWVAPKPTMHLPDTPEQTSPNSKKKSEKKREEAVGVQVFEAFGNIMFVGIFVVLVGIWLIMFRQSWVANKDFYIAVSTSDDPKETNFLDDEDDDDDEDDIGHSKRLDSRRVLSFLPPGPPTYEETQQNKTSLLKVSLDVSTSTHDDRANKLTEECWTPSRSR